MEEPLVASSLHGLSVPGLEQVNVPNLAVLPWAETLRRALKRAKDIVEQRMNLQPNGWGLHRYEYEQFYSGWVGLAFRFRACAGYDATFSQLFQTSQGVADNEALYQEDEAIFGFFVQGFTAIECFAYALYALGALIQLPTGVPILPPTHAFPLLDPNDPEQLRKITLKATRDAFAKQFPTKGVTEELKRLLKDSQYVSWTERRHLLAHRAASCGRKQDYSLNMLNPSIPPKVTQWVGDLPLTADLTSKSYEWLITTVNALVRETDALVRNELAYSDDELPPLIR